MPVAHLLNVGPSSGAAASWHAAARHAARHAPRHPPRHAAHAAALRVHRGHDGRADALDLLALVLKLLLLSKLIAFEPLQRIVNCSFRLALVVLRDLILDLQHHVAHHSTNTTNRAEEQSQHPGWAISF